MIIVRLAKKTILHEPHRVKNTSRQVQKVKQIKV